MATSGSPESDLCSIECFQNYTAPEVFVQGLAGQIDQQDVEAIIRAQKQMLQRFEKTNEMLSNCNNLASSRFVLAQKELKRHTTLLSDMKKDLDNIFKRIRNIKTKMAQQHPVAFSEVKDKVVSEADEDDERAAASEVNREPSQEKQDNQSTDVTINKRNKDKKKSCSERAKSEVYASHVSSNTPKNRLSSSSCGGPSSEGLCRKTDKPPNSSSFDD